MLASQASEMRLFAKTMSGIMILFLAGLTALAFLVVALRRKHASGPLRGILLFVAAAIVAYVAWMFISTAMK
jgi:hypothetical protein